MDESSNTTRKIELILREMVLRGLDPRDHLTWPLLIRHYSEKIAWEVYLQKSLKNQSPA